MVLDLEYQTSEIVSNNVFMAVCSLQNEVNNFSTFQCIIFAHSQSDLESGSKRFELLSRILKVVEIPVGVGPCGDPTCYQRGRGSFSLVVRPCRGPEMKQGRGEGRDFDP